MSEQQRFRNLAHLEGSKIVKIKMEILPSMAKFSPWGKFSTVSSNIDFIFVWRKYETNNKYNSS